MRPKSKRNRKKNMRKSLPILRKAALRSQESRAAREP